MDGVEHLPLSMIIAGIIWAVALGFATGNYACSAVHRIPRGRSMLEKKPYCGSCGTMLATKDLFPVISALLLRHKCRYCGAPIPKSHFWTEVLTGLLFALAFLQFNYGEQFLLVIGLGVFLIILASIHNNEGYISIPILVGVMVWGMLLRTLADGNIFDFFTGGLYGLIIGVIVWRKKVTKEGHRYTLPDGAKLTTAGGIVAGPAGLLPFLALFLIFYWPLKLITRKPAALSVAFGFAVILPLLYPDLLLLFKPSYWR